VQNTRERPRERGTLSQLAKVILIIIAHLLVVCLSKQPIKLVFTQMADNFYLPTSHYFTIQVLPHKFPESLFVELPDGASPLAVQEIKPPDDVDAEQIRWIATYNVQKAADDADYRSNRLEKAGKALDKLVERQQGTRPLSKDELLDRIETKLTKHSVQDMVTTAVNERGPPRLSWEIDDHGVMDAARLDGKSMFEITRAAERLSAAAVARAYRDRDTVEKFMESIKDVVRLRPHYVYTEQHVRARVFVCVLSVFLIAVLQLELEEAGKEMTGMKALETLRGVRRVEFSTGSDEAVVVKTTELSNEQEELAHLFDLST
jgi:hypothetical protein